MENAILVAAQSAKNCLGRHRVLPHLIASLIKILEVQATKQLMNDTNGFSATSA